MKKLLLIISIFFFCNNITFADGYKISGKIKGLKDKTSVTLAYYFGGKQYSVETVKANNGKFTFKGKEKVEGGMYLIVLPEDVYFDIIISEQEFSFSTDLDDLIGSMKFKNSVENPPFYEYLNFITRMQKQVTPIRLQLKSAKGNRKQKLQKEADEIDLEVKTYRENFINNYYDKFFTKIIIATTEINIPESPLDLNGEPDKTFPYRYYKKHFWDNIDFSDERMLRTPVFFSKMEQYLDKLTAKHPDSITISADILIEESRANDEIFQYVVSYITSFYERSKIMGMDAVFVHMVEKYYVTGQCNWVGKEDLKKIIERAKVISPNLIGKVSPPLLDFYGRPFMKDIDGNIYSLEDINAKYTIVLFYEGTSNFQKEAITGVKNLVEEMNKNYNTQTQVLSIYTGFSKSTWRNVIKNHQINEWSNVADINHDTEGNPVASSDWRDQYDIYSTPVIYLLDGCKKIVAKRVTVEQLKEIIVRIGENESPCFDNSKGITKGIVKRKNTPKPIQPSPEVTKPSNINRKNINWLGNGSGFLISRSGYIATNNHVIDGASVIEVEFKYMNEVQAFNAKVIKVDRTNDLAVIKIDDAGFLKLRDNIPYNFKKEIIDIGSEVFALGYPLALTLMGKDIKFTDGKISSKTGLAGDVTTYQIQVPIQPGNSGGPLFDTRGNLIGITSSGINRSLDLTENVNYAIKASYLSNLINVLPENIALPSGTQLASKKLTDQIKILSDYVVLIKVK